MKTALQAFFAICVLCLVGPCLAQDEAPSLAAHLLAPRTGDLPEMDQNRLIRVLTVVSMTNYYLMPGENLGYEYAMFKEFESFLGKGRGNRNPGPRVLFIPTPYNKLIPSLLAGKGDVIAAGLTATPERKRLVDFTRPYIPRVNEVVVTNAAVRPVPTAEDLSGRTVLVLASSSYRQSLDELNRRLAEKGREPVRIIAANEYLTPEDLLEIVASGAVEATVMDSHVAELWAKVMPGLVVNEGAVLRKEGALVWMVRKTNPQLKEKLDLFLSTHRQGTAMGDAAFRRVFERTEWIRNPLSGADLARFLLYKPMFQKYGAMYGVDWRLLICQAYRESGLNPQARSPSGHIGLLQLDPNLVNHPKLGVKNIQEPERNIQAGAKYLALIRNTHFDDGEMNPDEATRYALAGYNAGPNRIVRARSAAEDMGFDPNVWFGNGEVAAMKVAGPEPVRYVSEINKYFLIYSLTSQFKEEKGRARAQLGLNGTAPVPLSASGKGKDKKARLPSMAQ